MAAHPSRPAIDSLTAVRSRSVVAQAFCADPLLVWLFPEDDRRLDATAAWLGLFVEAYAAAARVDTIEEDGTIVAASVWREAIAERPPFAYLPSVGGLLRAFVGAERMADLGTGFGALGAAHPDHPHAYVQLLAVAPPHQGRGLGCRVLRACLDESDEAGEGVYLETMTERNVRSRVRATRWRAATPPGCHARSATSSGRRPSGMATDRW